MTWIGLCNDEVYTDQEIELIEAYIEDDKVSPRYSLVIKMLKELGLSVSELINIRMEYFDILGLQIEIHGKNNKRRILPMKMDLANDIRNYISNDRKNNKHSNSPYLLISERSPKLHRNTVLDIVKRMARELDMENAYNHKFRHSLATNRANRNVPIHLVQAMLGHVQVQTTIDYYISIDKDQLKSIMENM